MSNSDERCAALAAEQDIEQAFHLVKGLALGAAEAAEPFARQATLRVAIRALRRAADSLQQGCKFDSRLDTGSEWP
jgi:hypothetical protein